MVAPGAATSAFVRPWIKDKQQSFLISTNYSSVLGYETEKEEEKLMPAETPGTEYIYIIKKQPP